MLKLKRVGVVFSGQGSQYAGMGAAVVKEVAEEVDAALGFKFSAFMDEGHSDELDRTENAQVAILAHSVSAGRQLQTRLPDSPVCALGHSVGEYAALVFAGVLSLSDATRVVRARGEAMASAVPSGTPTAMSALLFASAEPVQVICDEVSRETGQVVQVANINSPQQVVVSGHLPAVEAVERRAKESKAARRCIRLRVSAPFHCSLMEPAVAKLKEALDVVDFSTPSLPIISNVAQRGVGDPHTLKRLLLRQVVDPVNWVACVRSAVADYGVDIFVEAGPGHVLTGLHPQTAPNTEGVHFTELVE